jgi:hypothetical protein
VGPEFKPQYCKKKKKKALPCGLVFSSQEIVFKEDLSTRIFSSAYNSKKLETVEDSKIMRWLQHKILFVHSRHGGCTEWHVLWGATRAPTIPARTPWPGLASSSSA